MSDATAFVAPALGAVPHDEPAETCGFCGSLAPARPADKVLKGNFTNGDELTSPWVCWACEACLDARETRSSHLVHDRVFRKVERKEIWRLLFDPPEPPFVLYLTLAGQKHGLFRQAVARSAEAFQLQCEDLAGWYRRAACEVWMRAAVQLRLKGVRRDSLESSRYDSSDFLKDRAGIFAWEARVQTLRSSQLFTILLGTMPGKEDLGDL